MGFLHTGAVAEQGGPTEAVGTGVLVLAGPPVRHGPPPNTRPDADRLAGFLPALAMPGQVGQPACPIHRHPVERSFDPHARFIPVLSRASEAAFGHLERGWSSCTSGLLDQAEPGSRLKARTRTTRRALHRCAGQAQTHAGCSYPARARTGSPSCGGALTAPGTVPRFTGWPAGHGPCSTRCSALHHLPRGQILSLAAFDHLTRSVRSRMLAVRAASGTRGEDLVGLRHQWQGRARVTPLAASLTPTLAALAARLAGRASGRRRLPASMASFPQGACPFVLPSQDQRHLFAQGFDFRSQGSDFGLQVGKAFCSVHAPILPACATLPE